MNDSRVRREIFIREAMDRLRNVLHNQASRHREKFATWRDVESEYDDVIDDDIWVCLVVSREIFYIGMLYEMNFTKKNFFTEKVYFTVFGAHISYLIMQIYKFQNYPFYVQICVS